MVNKCFLTLIIIFLFSPALRADTSLNPQRYPSFEITAGGNGMIEAKQDVTFRDTLEKRAQKSISGNLSGLAIIPLSNQWSASAGLGGARSAIKIDETTNFGGSNIEATNLSFRAGFDHFFGGDAESDPRSTNPDRVLAVSILFFGRVNVDSKVDAVSQGVEEEVGAFKFQNLSILGALSIPYNKNTFVIGFGGSLEDSLIAETPDTGGLKINSDGVIASLEWRYYFVNSAWTRENIGRNPSRWPSLRWRAIGETTLNGERIITLGAFKESQSQHLRRATLSTEIQFPLSRHLTARFEVGGTWSHLTVGESEFLPGNDTTSYSLSILTGFRYYFY